jgi:hypothetical protein
MRIPFSKYRTLIHENVSQTDEKDISDQLDHIDDVILDGGKGAFGEFKAYVEGILNYITGLDSDVGMNLDVDGGPTIYFGRSPGPDGTGEFFVGKNIFSDNRKINHNEREVQYNHGSKPGMERRLIQAITELKPFYEEVVKRIEGGIIEAQFLFNSSSDGYNTEEESLSGRDFITFQPNKTKYAIPVDHGSDLYNAVANARIGLVVNGIWKVEKGFEEKERLNTPDIVDELAEIALRHGLFIVNAQYSPDNFNASVSDSSIKKIRALLGDVQDNVNAISNELDDAFFGSEDSSTPEKKLVTYFREFVMDQIDRSTTGERTFYKDATQGKNFSDALFNLAFDKFIDQVESKEQDSDENRLLFKRINSRTGDFKQYLKATHLIVQIKSILLELFSKVHGRDKLGMSFNDDGEGFSQSKGEDGFVVYWQDQGKRISNRLISTQNRNPNPGLSEDGMGGALHNMLRGSDQLHNGNIGTAGPV